MFFHNRICADMIAEKDGDGDLKVSYTNGSNEASFDARCWMLDSGCRIPDTGYLDDAETRREGDAAIQAGTLNGERRTRHEEHSSSPAGSAIRRTRTLTPVSYTCRRGTARLRRETRSTKSEARNNRRQNGHRLRVDGKQGGSDPSSATPFAFVSSFEFRISCFRSAAGRFISEDPGRNGRNPPRRTGASSLQWGMGQSPRESHHINS